MRKYYLLVVLLLYPLLSSGEALLTPLPQQLKSQLPTPKIDVEAWVLADFESGWIIDSFNPNARIEPASLTKLMTGYLVFEAISREEVTLDEQVYVSKKAWKTSGSRMFIEVNTHVSIEQLLKGLIIQSGNDAAVALAEHIGGSEARFAAKMNQMAEKLGMLNTHFVNSNGLPDPQHYSSALDMSILTRALIRNFPERYRLYSEKEFTYDNITQPSRNILLSRDPTVDGVKTGYTVNAGYCLIASASRDGMRLIATVLGSKSPRVRADEVQSLLKYGYAAYKDMTIYRSDAVVTSVPLWLGQQSRAELGVLSNLSIIFPKGEDNKLVGTLNLPESLDAPLQVGQAVASVDVKFDGAVIRSASLHTRETYPQGNWFSMLVDSFKKHLVF